MNPKILKYTIVSSKTQAGLVEKVTTFMASRWVPFHAPGAAAFGMSPVGGNNYFQAMVKYEPTKEELEQKEKARLKLEVEEAEEAAKIAAGMVLCLLCDEYITKEESNKYNECCEACILDLIGE